MIKIIETKIYRGVPVVDAELVLVECEPEDAMLVQIENANPLHPLYYLYKGRPMAGKYLKPILISRTEKIEEGDWRIRMDVASNDSEFIVKCDLPSSGVIEEVERDNIEREIYKRPFYKILALPEHFSPKHLQAIVDGKLKEGKVLVECGEPCQLDKDYEGGYDCAYCKRKGMDFGDCTSKDNVIKLNSSNHITLHKVEDDIDVLEIVTKAMKRLAVYYTGSESSQIYGQSIDKYAKDWFEQNVK